MSEHDHAGRDDAAGDGSAEGTDAGSVDAVGRRVGLRVPSMDCPSCAETVGDALAGVEGVREWDLAPVTGRVTVVYDGDATTEAAVVAAVEDAGYPVTGVDAGPDLPDASDAFRSPRALRTAVAGVLLVFALPFAFLLPAPALATPAGPVGLSTLLLAGSIAAGGTLIVREGVDAARRLDLGIDLLMSVAVLGAVAVTLATGRELLIEAASLVVLFNVSELLERYSVDRARASLASLLDLAPETAAVRREGEVVEVPVESVGVGERVVVEPGAKIPLDGTVVEGESAVNEAPVTGESVPVDKTVGDEVYAGTVNEQGYLELAVTAPSDESTLSRVVELVERAQERKTDRERFVDRFSGYYTPAVVALAVLTALVPPLFLGRPVEWLVRGIALLVIACPCAFVISTPVTVVSGVTSAARNGVLVKGGDHLEAMGDVDIVAMDKTGTLTAGDLQVTDVVPFNGNDEARVLRCARGLERRSEHPIAEAIVGAAEDGPPEAVDGPVAVGDREDRGGAGGADGAGGSGDGVPGHGGAVSGFEALTGQGVRADLDGRTHYAGTPGLFADLGFDLSHVHFTTAAGDLPTETRDRCERAGCLDLVNDTIPRLQAEGKTVVLVGTASELEGLIAVADTVRPEAERTVAALRERGLRTVMLTGDNEGTARAVAEQVGVDEVHAGLLPEEKAERVEALAAEGTVAMVGDGVNDAPALAAATVGIAMGAAGSDTAIETADVALLGDDIARLPYLHDLATRANAVIRQNIGVSLGAKALLAAAIPLGLVSLVVAVLVGDVGMTTLVTGNAMRLSRIDPDDVLG